MADTFRAMCAELVDSLENARRIIQRADGTLHINTAEFVLRRARALLAEPEAEGPSLKEEALAKLEAMERLWEASGNTPSDTIRRALEAEGPTDEELLRVAATAIEPYESSGIASGEYEPETECAVEVYGSELIAFARAVLARWGRPAAAPVAMLPDDALIIEPAEHTLLVPVAQPVAVSERLPGPEDCDEQGRCWLWERDCGYSGCKWALVDRTWSLSQSDQDLSVYTHWLPFNALPLPAPEETK